MSKKEVKEEKNNTQGAYFLIIRSLQGIISILPKKYGDLKNDCQKLLEMIEKMDNEAILLDVKENPDKYLNPFSLACQTKITKIQEISIDCLHVNFFK
jgi:hypothetical protein